MRDATSLALSLSPLRERGHRERALISLGDANYELVSPLTFYCSFIISTKLLHLLHFPLINFVPHLHYTLFTVITRKRMFLETLSVVTCWVCSDVDFSLLAATKICDLGNSTYISTFAYMYIEMILTVAIYLNE